MKFCTNCGRQLEDSALFCPSCGTRATGQGVQATAPPPQPGTPYQMPSVSPTFGEADRYALSKLYLAAIVMLVGLIAGYALDFASGLFFAFSFITGNPNAPTTNPFEILRSSSFLLFIAIAAIIGSATELIYLAEFRLGLKSLSVVDRPNFGTPSTLTLLALITVPFVFLGVVIEFVGLIPFLATINPSQPPVTPTQLPAGLGYILLGGAISGIAGIAAIVGIIGGAILGVWRMGSRYNESIFKIGAILFVFPFVNIVAVILIILGVGSARKKLL
ncbi:MAG: DUF973 family protein [Nitrososphaerota archaeon]|nr:DUF973 family protein [Nitrososphaerota archaeon]